MDRADLIRDIRGCITTSKGKLSVRQLNNDYKLLMGAPIPYQKFGFRSLEEFLQSCYVFSLINIGDEYYVVAETSEKSAHITEMVNKQKTAKRRLPPKFSRKPIPARKQQTDQWRPKSRYGSNKYQVSNRPRFVNHSQFVNRSLHSVLSVASKVVIPEHSTFGDRKVKDTSSPIPDKGTDINKRLTSNRIKENMKSLTSENGLSENQASSLPSRNIYINNNNNEKAQVITKYPQTNLISTDPLVSTKMRLCKKISELSIDRDSGNSSPTNESAPLLSPSVSPEVFTRTLDPLADLKCFAALHKLGEVTVNTTTFNQKKSKIFSCRIKIGDKYTYSSYPNELFNPLEAQSFCCEKALSDLVPKFRRNSLLISSDKDILTRIPPMLEKHSHGVWAWQVNLDYRDKYNESLSDDWLKVIDSSPCVQIENISGNYILYSCKPGDKGHGRGYGGKVLPTQVSIPANTAHFGDDGKLLGQVTCVLSASEIWCEQVGTEESNTYTEMFGRLQIYYQEHEAQLIPDVILKDGYYIAKYEMMYYRIRALKIRDNEVDCFFIDCGDELAIPKTDIFVLQREYALSQAQAFVCRLAGLEDLYGVSINSDALYDKHIIIELAAEISSQQNVTDAIPVFMYDFETGRSINEALISYLTIELASPHLEPDGITEVYVTNIESNADVYVIVKTQGYEYFQKQRQQIEEQITLKPPTDTLYRLCRSNSREKLYFFRNIVTGRWERVKLIDWSADESMAQVYFVDLGSATVVNIAEEKFYPLEAISEVFNNYPYQAVRTRMDLNVIPSNFVELASRDMPEDHPILLKIDGETEDGFPLVKLFRRNVDGGLFCVNESVALSSELTNRRKQEDMRKRFQLNRTAQVPSTGLLKSPPLIKEAVNEYVPICVPVAVSPYNFFIQPFSSKADLDNLMETLQQRYKDVQYGNLKVEEILPGSIYAAKYDDGTWYRVSVIKVISSGSSVSVCYCDFGYYQTMSVKQLVPLAEEFLQLPYQAVKAKLSNIKPKQDKWTMDDCEFFKQLIEKRMLYAKVITTEKDVLHESDIVLKLDMIDTSSEDDVIISQVLIERDIAVKEEETV